MFETPENKIHKNVPNDVFFDASKYPYYDKLNFVIYQYEEQEKSTHIRLNSKRNEMYLYILMFIAVTVAEIFFLSLRSQISIHYPGAWGIWIGFMVAGFLFVKSAFGLIERIFEFNVNNETPAFLNYKAKNRIFTIRSEQRFCVEQISSLKNMLKEIEAETDMNEKMKSRYSEIVYIDRRAEQKVFTVFEKHKIICNIVAIGFVVFLVVM